MAQSFLGINYSTPFIMTKEVNSSISETVNFKRFSFSSSAYRHKFSIPLRPVNDLHENVKLGAKLKSHFDGVGYDKSFRIDCPQYPGTDLDDDRVVLTVGSYPDRTTDRVRYDTFVRERIVPIEKTSGPGRLDDILTKINGRFIRIGNLDGVYQVRYNSEDSIRLLGADFTTGLPNGNLDLNPELIVFYDHTKEFSIKYNNAVILSYTLNVVEDVDSIFRIITGD